jgi:hypothetical protein
MSDTKEEYYRKKWMSDDQWQCAKLLADVHGGFNHMFGKLKASNDNGVTLMSTCTNYMSTFDYSTLTRLVVLAHDRMIRVEISSNSPRGKMEFYAHKRQSREGDSGIRHPTIETAIQTIRSEKY